VIAAFRTETTFSSILSGAPPITADRSKHTARPGRGLLGLDIVIQVKNILGIEAFF
jgi:hypothetical protein